MVCEPGAQKGERKRKKENVHMVDVHICAVGKVNIRLCCMIQIVENVSKSFWSFSKRTYERAANEKLGKKIENILRIKNCVRHD
jgi:hypothetical protein